MMKKLFKSKTMKTLKKILKFKVMIFPDYSYFNVRDIIIGAIALAIFVFFNQN